jgi:hypothetical protein
MPIPPENRLVVSQFLTRVNMWFRLGFLSLDLDDGEVSFRLGYDLEGTPLSQIIVKNMILCKVHTINAYLAAIMRICYGGISDMEALRELDKPQIGVEVQLGVNPTDTE